MSAVNKRHFRVVLIEPNDSDAELILRELRDAGMQVAHERVDSAESLASALNEFTPDVVISDHSVKGFDFRAALNVVHAVRPRTPLIIVSGPLRAEDSGCCVRAGAETVVSKTNLALLAPAVIAAVEARAPLDKLTARQLEVMRLVANGYRTREVAETLRLSEKTVESHRQQLMRRLGLENTAGLVRYAVRVGLALASPASTIARMLKVSAEGGAREDLPAT
jgi:DNA-binding NarL/FixJ family response regulator